MQDQKLDGLAFLQMITVLNHDFFHLHDFSMVIAKSTSAKSSSKLTAHGDQSSARLRNRPKAGSHTPSDDPANILKAIKPL